MDVDVVAEECCVREDSLSRKVSVRAGVVGL